MSTSGDISRYRDPAYQLARGWTFSLSRLLADAESGDVDAMLYVALNRLNQYQDPKGALAWYEKAANLGNVEAMMNAAAQYENCSGCDLSVPKACQYWEQAAGASSNPRYTLEAVQKLAYYKMGATSHARDKNGLQSSLPRRDPVAALKLFEQAAEMGDADCAAQAGNAYMVGSDPRDPPNDRIKVDYDKGIYWLRKAASMGHGQAAFQMAGVYMAGVVPADQEEQQKWLEIADSLGNEEAKAMLACGGARKAMTRKEARHRVKEAEMEDDEELRQFNRNIAAPLVACSNPPCENMERKGQPRFSRCGRCHKVKYCSRDCQKKHHKVHKKECAALSRAANEATELLEKLKVSNPKADDDDNGVVFTISVFNGWTESKVSTLCFESAKKNSITATLPRALGIDLLLIRDDCNSSDGANPDITLFMTDPSTGKAPSRWRGNDIGAYKLVRPDRERYSAMDHEYLRDYALKLQQSWSSGKKPSEASLSPIGLQNDLRKKLDDKYLLTELRAPLDRLQTILAPRVRLQGLKSQVALNGQEGFRGRWIESEQRFELYLDSKSKLICVKPVNIDLLPEDPKLTAMVLY